METYVLKTFDRRIMKDSEVQFNSLDQALGALIFVSSHPDFCFRSLEILAVE